MEAHASGGVTINNLGEIPIVEFAGAGTDVWSEIVERGL
jgi:hypothetical protein